MRRLLTLLHRYAGLTLAGFLILSGLTGAVIAFEQELDAALNPRLFRVQSGAIALPIDQLVARIEAGDARVRVSAVEIPRNATRSAIIRVVPRDASQTIGFDQIFANPATGAVLGQRLWGGCCFAQPQIIPFLYELHYTLHLPGMIGAYLMGGVALLWLFDCFVGLALAWPRGDQQRGWKRSLSLKRGASRYRLWYDLHRATGLWAWLLLTMMAMTGVAVSLRAEVFKPIVSLFSALAPAAADLPMRPATEDPPTLSFQQAIDISVRHASAGDVPSHPAYILHEPGAGLYGVALSDGLTDPRDGLGPSWTYLDDRTGKIRQVDQMGQGSRGDVFLQAQFPMHNGRIAGLPGRILIAFIGLAVAGLSITGIIIWWRKRRLPAR